MSLISSALDQLGAALWPFLTKQFEIYPINYEAYPVCFKLGHFLPHPYLAHSTGHQTISSLTLHILEGHWWIRAQALLGQSLICDTLATSIGWILAYTPSDLVGN